MARKDQELTLDERTSVQELAALSDSASNEALAISGGQVVNKTISGGGLGDVVGPASSTDNALVLYDGTTGTLIKDGPALGSAGQVLTSNGAGSAPSFQNAGSGDFSGPASATDNAIVRFDGTGGKTGQNSGVVVDDSDNITGVTSITVGNTGLVVGSSTPFSDSSGTLTLQNVDALDATTEATIESAIDTLSNLTSAPNLSITESQISDLGAYITASSSDTLTNKTIDGDNNTISNLALGTEVTGASTDLTDTASLVYLATLASTANGDGASLVGIEDAGGLITATTVEGALAENRTAIDAIEADYLTSSDIGSSVQAWDAQLDDIAGLTPASSLIIGDGLGGWTTVTPGNFITDNNILDTADIGASVQGYDAGLASIASLTTAADRMIYTTASDTYAVTTLTSFGRSILDDADAATARATLVVDAAGTDNSTDVTIAAGLDYITISGQELTLGSVDLTTDITGTLPVANGGTGATTESGARTNLGLAIGTDVQAHGDVLDDLNTLGASTTDGEFLVATGAGTLAWESGATARVSLGVDAAGTDNSTDVTLAGTPDYLTISGQEITLNQIDLTADVTGVLPEANLPDASTTAQGVSELATSAEVTAGTDTGRTITPDALAGSDYGKRYVSLQIEAAATDLAVGDALNGNFWTAPDEFAGWNIVGVVASVVTAGTTGTTDFQLRNITQTSDVLSTKATIDSGETSSLTAATAPVINTSEDDITAGDTYTVDVDAVAGTAPKGGMFTIIIQAP